jgi:hypothetical protein
MLVLDVMSEPNQLNREQVVPAARLALIDAIGERPSKMLQISERRDTTKR